ncbi:MAG: GNAT family N-acetyltransferase [Natronincolaceae bacterium]|nr:GNAT family N-acetyltransferase [Bacillota bacterium]NLK90528.1 GNAT family N-acetyltransferase [Clostridiales bacterium]
MSEVVIRSAVIEDIGQLSDMYCEMYDILFTYGMPYKLDKKIIGEVLILQLKARACKYFVAEKDEQLVGFVAVDVMRMDRKLSYKNNVIGHIRDIYVSFAVGRTGIGTKLLAKAEDWARENGASIIECNVIANNEPAQNFWDDNQYEILGKIYCKKFK